MTAEFTDTENTGLPVVPDLRDDYDRRESFAETVQSHRLTPATDD